MEENNQVQQRSFLDLLVMILIKLKPSILKLLRESRKLLIINGSVGIVTALILYTLIKPYFQSTVTILPDFGNKSSDMLSQFSGLAAMAGVSVGGDVSTQIYQNLVMSETVISEVIYKMYQTEKFKNPINLVDYFEIELDASLPDSLQQRKRFLDMFDKLTKERILINYELKTKILTITVEMPESRLASDVANTLVASLDKYVRTQRKSFASEQRKYLVARVQQIKDTLTLCEEATKTFREKNRVVSQSPELMLEQSRLMRNVEIQQSIYVELMKQLELVKLAEVKDVPVVNLREQAKDPVVKYGPKKWAILLTILFFSFICSSGWFLGRDLIVQIVEQVRRA